MKRVPIVDRAKEIVAHALVDDEDYECVMQHSWHLSGRNYVQAKVGGRNVYLHRFILQMRPGDNKDVDHDNRNTLDNQKHNLKPCTRRRNLLNNGGKGYYPHSSGRGYVAMIGRTYLGYYIREDDAARIAAAYRSNLLEVEV